LQTKKTDLVMIVASLLYGGAMIYLCASGYIYTESPSLLIVAVSAIPSGLLTCIGLLKCYRHLGDSGNKSPQSLLYIALIGSLLLFLLVYWLANPVKIIVFSLLPLLGFIALSCGHKTIMTAQDDRIINQNATSQASEYLNTRPIHLNRYTHFAMFALQLTLAYCIAQTLRTWTPLTVSCTIALSVAAAVFLRLSMKKKPLALGELGKVALPLCIALLFCVVSSLAIISELVAPFATTLFLLIGIMNIHWLIRTSVLFNLSAIKHISAGRLPLIIGTVCGVALSLITQQLSSSLPALADHYQLRLLVSGAIAVILIITYTLLPFNQGTPIKEGIMQSDFSSPRKSPEAKQARPFKEICTEFGHLHGLTTREQEVLFLLACGYNAETIAQLFIVSGNTIRTHVSRIYQKTDIHSQQELIKRLDKLFKEKYPSGSLNS
jgi:DNA-binding CsgD family transcriptional regulator